MDDGEKLFARKYYNRWAESYETGIRLRFWFWRLLRKTWRRILLEDGALVYDMGCGTGNLLLHIHEEYPKAVLYGTDVSEGMLEKARDKFRSIDDMTVSLKIADMNDLFPWDDGMFDYAVSTFCFHYAKDPVKTLKEMFRILKPGGTLYLADLCYLPGINNLVDKVYPRVLEWEGHIEFLGRSRLRRAMEEAGFVKTIQSRISLFAVFSSAVRA